MNVIPRILIINTGSTSTKLALFKGDSPLFQITLHHTQEELARFSGIPGQYSFRRDLIQKALSTQDYDPSSLSAVVGRGGILHPMQSGTYRINQPMLEDLMAERYGSHASNLSCLLAHELAQTLDIPAYTVDPVVIDEMDEIARITGCPGMRRRSRFHALNQKAVAKGFAASRGVPYDSLNLIVAHLGGGCSIGIHQHGRVVDVNDGLDGDGPFSSERPGSLPVIQVIDLCFSGQYATADEMKRTFTSQMGLAAHLGTNDGREVVSRIKAGDQQAELIYRAMCYQIAKAIGAGGAVLRGNVDQILLTGGFAHDSLATGWITEQVGYLAPVTIIPGEDEMAALARGALRVLQGEEPLKEYLHEP